MASSVPSLLSAASGAAGKPSRSASAVVAKATRGFQVFRIDGYSWTKALPGGERITSEQFTVGGRRWYVDYYPNGSDGSQDESDSISLYVRLMPTGSKERVRAQYKFSLLDLAGNAAYEFSAETGIFFTALHMDVVGCGHACFIAKAELEKRRDSLLREDCLAIRCDVAVTELTTMSVGPKNERGINHLGYGYGGRGGGYGYHDGSESPDEDGERKGKGSQPDDREYIRRCLSVQRRK